MSRTVPLAFVASAIAMTASCTSSFRLSGGVQHSDLQGDGGNIGTAIAIGKTIEDDTSLLLMAGADLSVVREDGGLSSYWSSRLGLDFLHQFSERNLAGGVGGYISFAGGTGDRDYIGPGLRVALFPWARGRRGESSPHVNFEYYNVFRALGFQLDGQYIEGRGTRLDPSIDDSGFVISLRLVYEASTISRSP